MFAFPVTIPVRSPDGVYPVDVTVNIDDVLTVTSLYLVNNDSVESSDFYSCLPASELLLTDGRKLPILETATTIHRYLDAYRQIESFYTQPADPSGIRNGRLQCTKPDGPRAYPLDGTTEGNVIPLFGSRSCASSEAPTPD